MKFSVLFALLSITSAFAGPSDPETVVEISIYDLIPKTRVAMPKKKIALLPESYGQEVAKRISAQKVKLIDCIEVSDSPSAIYSVALAITGAGAATVTSEGESPLPKCITEILSKIEYPTHPLTEPAIIKLPLKLSRRQK